ncbi:uncharacterized protein TRIADDRAFT_50511 [Trichoplax adhaerens]|uniref:Solute carrier family 25 member 32 n=1 Tax=Trichoplax adhaerens TaxID=10228 RepID=B3S135_TRIAD|nr:hypothetical protein TRIADDRAFT_50511 [Trichoplax adhaerens]EDV23496.1 hypothetical protein TRIADDRAFT_50511 [Trichoplax adhaerens]|eukprot:XP_002114406.1 hypothetical protein TRIADDRAFT_50511 [Trichoplax adhaerens]
MAADDPGKSTPSDKYNLFRTIHSAMRHLNYDHLVAGVCGGVIATLSLHPLDVIKVKFQVGDGHFSNRPNFNGLVQACKSTTQLNGLRGFYQGVIPNMWGAGSSWGLYFFFYNAIKANFQAGSNQPLGPTKHMTAAAISGVCTLTMTNPIWVVKTRMILQTTKTGEMVVSAPSYNGLLDGLSKIYKYEGIRGFYKGYAPGLFGVSHGVIQFVAYEECKKAYNKFRKQSNEKHLSAIEYICMAAISKTFASSTTYPYQVVRSRLQDPHIAQKYDGSIDAIRKIIKYEGFRGFYKGLTPNLIRVTPATCITFVVYEKMSYFLKKRRT